MTSDARFQKQVQRIGELLEKLEATTDPNARSLAKELVESLLALHGAAVERMLEIASAAENGGATIQNFGQDDLISSVLLLYGLHPDDLQARVARALEKKRNYLESHHATAELQGIAPDGAVTVRLHTKASGGCGSTAEQLKSALEAALQDAAPDAPSIVVEDASAGPGFVPLAQLASGGMALRGAQIQPQPQRSGD